MYCIVCWGWNWEACCHVGTWINHDGGKSVKLLSCHEVLVFSVDDCGIWRICKTVNGKHCNVTFWEPVWFCQSRRNSVYQVMEERHGFDLLISTLFHVTEYHTALLISCSNYWRKFLYSVVYPLDLATCKCWCGKVLEKSLNLWGLCNVLFVM